LPTFEAFLIIKAIKIKGQKATSEDINFDYCNKLQAGFEPAAFPNNRKRHTEVSPVYGTFYVYE
jgi:hypothetical protein